MPIYAYRCESCGFEKDVLQKLSDAPLTQCPECGEGAFRKQLTAAGFQLKGSGWYVTDFRGGNSRAQASGGAEDTGSATGEGADSAQGGAAKQDGAVKNEASAKRGSVGSESAAKANPPSVTGAASAAGAVTPASSPGSAAP